MLVSAVQQMNQLCVSICPTVLDFLPIYVTTENWVEFSVLYSGFSLVIYFINRSLAQLLQSCPTHYDPMDCSPPAPLSMGFSRQEYWSGLPCPSPRDLPDPGIEPMSPVAPALQADSLPLGHWESLNYQGRAMQMWSWSQGVWILRSCLSGGHWNHGQINRK